MARPPFWSLSRQRNLYIDWLVRIEAAKLAFARIDRGEWVTGVRLTRG